MDLGAERGQELDESGARIVVILDNQDDATGQGRALTESKSTTETVEAPTNDPGESGRAAGRPRSGLGAGLERDGQTWAQGQARRRSRVACPVRNGLLPRPRGFVVCAGSQIGPSDHHPWPVCVGTYSEARPGPVTAWESVDSTDIRAGCDRVSGVGRRPSQEGLQIQLASALQRPVPRASESGTHERAARRCSALSRVKTASRFRSPPSMWSDPKRPTIRVREAVRMAADQARTPHRKSPSARPAAIRFGRHEAALQLMRAPPRPVL